MPVLLTFDIANAPSADRNRIQSFFERFGWQNLGGTSYRYPKLGTEHPMEDWFNHVIPALMLFRTYVLKSQLTLTRFTLDVQSSTGLNPDTKFGKVPQDSKEMKLCNPTNPSFGQKNLRKWLKDVEFPYKVGKKPSKT